MDNNSYVHHPFKPLFKEINSKKQKKSDLRSTFKITSTGCFLWFFLTQNLRTLGIEYIWKFTSPKLITRKISLCKECVYVKNEWFDKGESEWFDPGVKNKHSSLCRYCLLQTLQQLFVL